MIGNDIVDLKLALKESNWRRRGFLNKIFTSKEQQLILNSENQDRMVWNLWSRKEASYKIYNRQTAIRGFFPLRLECDFKDETTGTISIDDFVYHTQTEIASNYIYTVAVTETECFKKIKNLDVTINVNKENGVPYFLDPISNSRIPVSITHHGSFKRIISAL
jgi:phosphopantetheinyl transferase (holo-ACP synthase)